MCERFPTFVILNQLSKPMTDGKPKGIYQEINELYNEVLAYRNTGKLQDLLQFCARMQTIGAYNAMLVHMQMPGAMLVLSRKRWEQEMCRRVTPNARPLIILIPFGPIELVFDVTHTDAIPGAPRRYSDKLEALMHPYPVIGEIDDEILEKLQGNLRYFGIYFTDDYNAGTGECAQFTCFPRRVYYDVTRWENKFSIPFPLSYQLSVDHRKTPEERFVSICHELGHHFCGHLTRIAPKDEDPKERKRVEEFEAEIVAWVVASRRGFKDSGAVPFLSQYADYYGQLPEIDIRNVLSAVDQIEKMFEPIDIKQSWLYKNNDSFKQSVDSILVKP